MIKTEKGNVDIGFKILQMESLNFERNRTAILQDPVGNKAIPTNRFTKKTQETPPSEITFAVKYRKDYERRYGR